MAAMRRAMTAFRRLAMPLLLAAVCGAAPAGCSAGKPGEASASTAPVLTVSVEPARMRSMVQTLDLTGTIAAWDLLPVNPAANGLRIVAVKAEEGQHVKKGQLSA